MNCYWNETGFHQRKLMKLHTIIPDAGPVQRAANNPALEKLRKAINCYHDLYNNALINRAQSFAAVFGFRSTDYVYLMNGHRVFSQTFYKLVEEKMDTMIMAAWLEQQKKGTIS